ncbi:MAG: lysophospholipid acyltransferase family protein [Dermatophilaceae bacterium]|nr:1-acyl-sn-glycerol-3-phosphate acyltransferase [Intrasporangiaceae bacterium]
MFFRAVRQVLIPLSHAAFRPTITGQGNVPKTGGVLLASNHLSFIDSFTIPLASPRPVSFLAKSDYFTGAGVGGAMRRELFTAMGAIPVDRNSASAAQESLDSALEVLRAGGAFGIYPEGTRSRDGRLYRGRTGVAWLALTADVPVVPVGLLGTEDVQPVGAAMPRIAKVAVKFGEPLQPSAYAGLPAGRARRQLTDDVMAAIQALTGQEPAGTYNDLASQPA